MPSLHSLSSLPGECGAELLDWQSALAEPLRVQEARLAEYDKRIATGQKYLRFERLDHTGMFKNPSAAAPGVAKQMMQQFRETHSLIAERAQQLLFDWDKPAMPARLWGEPPVSLEDSKDPAWSQVFRWHHTRLGTQKFDWLHKTFRESVGQVPVPPDQFPAFLTTLREAS